MLIRCASCWNVYKIWILLTEVYWRVPYESKGRRTPKFRKILDYRPIDMVWQTRRTESSARSANGDCLYKKVNWLILKMETELFLCEAGSGFFLRNSSLKELIVFLTLRIQKRARKVTGRAVETTLYQKYTYILSSGRFGHLYLVTHSTWINQGYLSSQSWYKASRVAVIHYASSYSFVLLSSLV